MSTVKPLTSDLIVVVLAATVAICAAIGGAVYVSAEAQKNLSKNIEIAIQKGVNPIAVRCAHASSSDAVCVVYAAIHETPNKPAVEMKVK